MNAVKSRFYLLARLKKVVKWAKMKEILDIESLFMIWADVL